LRPPLLIAPDSFKGTLRATQVAAALGRGFEACGEVPPDLCPIADGGDGTTEVLLTALGGSTAGAEVTGLLGEPVRAGIALLEDGGTAVVEVAAAAGFLPGATPEQAWAASSRGVGELVLAAAAQGAEVVVLAAGGLGGARLVVLCDVRTPFERAAEVFGPQKGADPPMVARLTARLDELATALPRDPRGVPGTGAAGGLAGGLWAAFDAVLERGATFVLDALDFDARMRAAHAVVVGEGRLDATSLQGKALGEAATRARQAGVPCHAVVGTDALDPMGHRILDLQKVVEAGDLGAIEAAAAAIAPHL
jgi:glycerate 2-kinase